MGSRRSMSMVALLLAALVASSAAQFCNMSEEDLNACRPAVSWLTPEEPSKACCTALSTADLPCFCSYKNSLLLPSLGIDLDLAMALPAKCGLTTPTQC